MSQITAVKAFAKLLAFTLGVDPYELGLIPDGEGYVKLKELLKAVTEEEGWRHIREGHIREVLLSVTPSPIEVAENRVRAVDRSRLALPRYVVEVPGELYAAIRQRAWPGVHERGLAATDELIRLTPDKAFARRLGRRVDPNPVILTVHTPRAEELGIVFLKAADHLYLAHELPAKTLSGPALPKPSDPKRQAVKKKPKTAQPPPPGPGVPEADPFAPNPAKAKGSKKDKESWKENKKRFRRDKERLSDDL